MAAVLEDPMVPRVFRVRGVKREAPDTVTLDLLPPPGAGPLAFAPGQFNMLYAPGAGEAAISISGSPDEPDHLLHTVRLVGRVTQRLGRLRKGDSLGLRGPFGTGWPLKAAEGHDLLIVAGGIGLAPLRPVLLDVLARRERFGRLTLLYGARRPEEMLYPQELQDWRGRFDMDVHVTVDRAERGWRGHVGVVTTLVRRAAIDPTATLALVCGPEVMMRFTVMELQKQRMEAEHIYLSMERNMKCGLGLCGHCQCGPWFICKDGPVLSYDRLEPWMNIREV